MDRYSHFSQFNLRTQLCQALVAAGITKPTEIQQHAIPIALQGSDIIMSAPTGTGKTVAYLIPALEYLANKRHYKSRSPRVVILAPTRELAKQIHKSAQRFICYRHIRLLTLIGGIDRDIQKKWLCRKIDLLIATPGRLIKFISHKQINVSNLEMLIVDEMDRLFDSGFIHEVARIVSAMPALKQTILVSATSNADVLEVAKNMLDDPIHIEVGNTHKPPSMISQWIHQVDDMRHKKALLYSYLENDIVSQTIIFTATKTLTSHLARELRYHGYSSAALHSDIKQSTRNHIINDMYSGEIKILVATDLAARGLDIPTISHVFNFDLPHMTEDYIHRVGRTGRCNTKGIAISFVGPQDWNKLHSIEKLTRQYLKRKTIPGLEPKKIIIS